MIRPWRRRSVAAQRVLRKESIPGLAFVAHSAAERLLVGPAMHRRHSDSSEHLSILYQIVTTALRAERVEENRDTLRRLGKYLLGLAICLESASKSLRDHERDVQLVYRDGRSCADVEVIIANRERVAFQLRILVEESKTIRTQRGAQEFFARVRSLMEQIDAAANDLSAYSVEAGGLECSAR